MSLSRNLGPNPRRTNLLILGVFSALTTLVLKAWAKVLEEIPTAAGPSLASSRLGWGDLGGGNTLLLVIFVGLMGALGYQLTLGRSRIQHRSSASPNAQPPRIPYSPLKSRTDLRLERLKQGIQQRPQDPNTWLELGVFLEHLRQYREAIAIYTEGLTHHPEHPQLWFSHGLAQAKAGDFRRALSSYNEAVQRQPHNSEFWHAQGDALLELERYPEALESLRRVQRYSPNFGHIWSDRGLALYKLARYEEAAEELRQAVRRDPRDERSWFHRGEALLVMNRLRAAQENSRKALRIHPESELLNRQDRHIRARLGILP